VCETCEYSRCELVLVCVATGVIVSYKLRSVRVCKQAVFGFHLDLDEHCWNVNTFISERENN